MKKLSHQFTEVPRACLRPELELLLCCARTRMDPETAERIRGQVHEDTDWEFLIRTAVQHQVVPLLYRSLKTTCQDAVPKVYFDQLRAYFYVNAHWSFVFTEELLDLLNLFEAHGIPALPFKGPVLAHTVYGDVSLREFVDLDIFVQRRNVLRAKDLLISRGYLPLTHLNGTREADYVKLHIHHDFVDPDDKVLVELHWALTRWHYCSPIDPERVWGRLVHVSLDGKKVLNLSPADLFLVLCVHAARHRWCQLQWICDIAELVRVNYHMDWGELMELARTLGSQRVLFLGLYLASDLLGAELPEEVSGKIQSDPLVKVLAAQVYERLFSERDGAPGFFENPLFQLRLKERLRDKVRYIVRSAAVPSHEDWEYLPLPTGLSCLYYLSRPFRLLEKHALGVVKRARREGRDRS